MEYIIDVRDLIYTYADGTRALDGINLKIKKGEKIAVMGANGSGKSTFFLTLNGIAKPDKGEIYISGKKIGYSRKELIEVRKKVGIVFQDPDNQLFSANVRQEISFGPLNLGYSQDEVRCKVDEIIKELNIKDFENKPTHFLSGGQKKRVSIADVLVMDPEIVILDEPASGLDPKHIKLIDEIIDKLSEKNITVIIATHDVQRTLAWADRLILFKDGKVLSEGLPKNLLRDENLLKETNLEKPETLCLFDSLVKRGLIDDYLEPPKTYRELEEYLDLMMKGRK